MTDVAEDAQQLADRVVGKLMAADRYSQWLGVEVLETAPQRSTIRMTVRDEMVNGFGTAHGGIVFGLADSAFAFACNAQGRLSVAVDCSVNYPAAVRPGDVLTAIAVEETSTNRLAFCAVTVRNQHDSIVGFFRGTVYRTSQEHFPATAT